MIMQSKPIFLTSLKRNGHLEKIHLTICIVGSRKVREQDDYGSQGWDTFAPNLTIYGFDVDEDACIVANTNLDERQINWWERHYPLVLWRTESEATLYGTRNLESSSLYEPNIDYLQRFSQLPNLLEVDFTIEVETTTLDNFCKSERIKHIDFLQIDAQGAELPILEGAIEVLERGILAVQTEVSFSPVYLNQPLFADVDRYLRNKGFTLFDLAAAYYKREQSPVRPKNRPGQMLWGECIYFRDLIQANQNLHLQEPEQLFKLACIADMLDFPDYALELLVYLTLQYGENYNFADNIVESLAQSLNTTSQKLESLPIIPSIKPYLSERGLSFIV